VQVCLDRLRLSRPRTWGALLVGGPALARAALDSFFAARLGCSREGTEWEKIVRLLTLYRLLSPAANGGCIGTGLGPRPWRICWGSMSARRKTTRSYRALDRVLAPQEALFVHLRQRWSDLFGATFDVLLYDLTRLFRV